jgi:hypothetical protein
MMSTQFTVTPGLPPFDFTLALSPSSRTVNPGDPNSSYSTGYFEVSVTYSDPSYSRTAITFQGVTGLGPGMNYNFYYYPAGMVYYAILMVSTSLSTPTSSYTLTLTGSANGVVRQASAVLVVQPFDFSISISPTEQAIVPYPGQPNKVLPSYLAVYTITVSLVSGVAQDVALSLSAPSLVQYAYLVLTNNTLIPTHGIPSFTSTFTIAVGCSASGCMPPGQYELKVTGTTALKTHSAKFTLIVQPLPATQSLSYTNSSVRYTNSSRVTQAPPLPPTQAFSVGLLGVAPWLAAVAVLIASVIAILWRRSSNATRHQTA